MSFIFQDLKKALHWFRKAAFNGNPQAQTTIGAMYLNGMGMDKDYYTAFEWFDKAATQGFPEAQYNLGIMYVEGLAVSKNDNNALKWLRKASIQGHTGAAHSLAELIKRRENNQQRTLRIPRSYEKTFRG